MLRWVGGVGGVVGQWGGSSVHSCWNPALESTQGWRARTPCQTLGGRQTGNRRRGEGGGEITQTIHTGSLNTQVPETQGAKGETWEAKQWREQCVQELVGAVRKGAALQRSFMHYSLWLDRDRRGRVHGKRCALLRSSVVTDKAPDAPYAPGSRPKNSRHNRDDCECKGPAGCPRSMLRCVHQRCRVGAACQLRGRPAGRPGQQGCPALLGP